MKILKKSPNEPEAVLLMDELSETLECITGNSGKNSFSPKDVCVPRSLFVVAYDEYGKAIGCGGIRPIDENTAEVKRLFAKVKSIGVGTKILFYLEEQAREFNYSSLWLETRLMNKQAVSFYKSRGYHQIPNYGKYIGNIDSICFEKKII